MCEQLFGEILVEMGLLTDEQVQQVLEVQKTTQQNFGQITIQLGLATADQVWEAWARQMSYRRRFVEPMEVGIDTVSTLSLNIRGSTTSEKSVFTIIGQAEPGSRVLVNGLLAQVDSDGYFTFDLDLKQGSNKVQVVAIDPAGNTEQLTRSISYAPIADIPEWMVWTVAILVVSGAACVITVLLARSGRRTGY